MKSIALSLTPARLFILFLVAISTMILSTNARARARTHTNSFFMCVLLLFGFRRRHVHSQDNAIIYCTKSRLCVRYVCVLWKQSVSEKFWAWARTRACLLVSVYRFYFPQFHICVESRANIVCVWHWSAREWIQGARISNTKFDLVIETLEFLFFAFGG